MNREIKFRVWDEQSNEWMYAGLKNGVRSFPLATSNPLSLCLDDRPSDSYENTVLRLNDDELIWCQYTGLLDKNGVEIYEGDIVETGSCVWDNTGQSAIMQVVFINDHQSNGFVGKILNGDSLSGLYIPIFSRLDSSYKVIGNMYENPELLVLNK